MAECRPEAAANAIAAWASGLFEDQRRASSPSLYFATAAPTSRWRELLSTSWGAKAQATWSYWATAASRAARTCYDHLAGQLGTAITDALIARRHIRPRGKDFVLATSGRACLAGLGVDIVAAQGRFRATETPGRRLFARRCLDWTERRYHLGGALGAALARRCFEAGWLRRPDDDRVIRPTLKGARAFADHFGVVAAD